MLSSLVVIAISHAAIGEAPDLVAPASAAVVVAGGARIEAAPGVVAACEVEGARCFAFRDGGAVRLVRRVVDDVGTDESPVEGMFLDPLTGRTAPVRIGASVIVRGAVPADALPVREIFAALDMRLVKSTRPGEDAAALAERLMHQGVEAYPDLAFRQRPLSVDVPPNDPRYPGQFYFDEIDIEDAWAVSTGSSDVTVLVADNGCDMQHPDLASKMDPGFDPFENDGDPSYVPNADGNEHGTACAGLIGAVTDNDVDIAGTCPECRLRCARLLPAADEPVTLDSDVQTYGFAFEQEVDIVSNSWGFVDAIPVPTPLKDSIVQVQQHGRNGKGAVVVFASGNDDRVIADDELLAVPGVLGVGAVNNLGELTQFSNGGNSVDVVAPTGTLTTDISGPDGLDPGDVTTTFGGTSSACPLVAGVAGLLLGHEPGLTADEVNARITASAKQSVFATPDAAGHDTFYGFGLVQPAKALAGDAQPPAPPPADTGCGCATTPAQGAFPAVLALSVVWWWRRRRPLRPVKVDG